jgi:hypothetical protein
LTKELGWFPLWALWIVLPWVALHFYYDFSISRQLRAQRKPGERAPGGPLGFLRYAEIMRENARRFERGDLLARVVTYYDWVIMGGFLLLVISRMILMRS